MTPEQLPPLPEPITQDMVDCWRVNYGLDTRSPADAAAYWDEQFKGMAPAGAVAALGLVLLERDLLRAELDALRPDAERLDFLQTAKPDISTTVHGVADNGSVVFGFRLGRRQSSSETIRAAIDAAMKETP